MEIEQYITHDVFQCLGTLFVRVYKHFKIQRTF